MAETLGLELEIAAHFDSAKNALNEMRDRVRQTFRDVRTEAGGVFAALTQVRIGLSQLGRGDLGGVPNLVKAFTLVRGSAEDVRDVMRLVDASLVLSGATATKAADLYGTFRESLVAAAAGATAFDRVTRLQFEDIGVNVERALLQPEKAFGIFLRNVAALDPASQEAASAFNLVGLSAGKAAEGIQTAGQALPPVAAGFSATAKAAGIAGIVIVAAIIAVSVEIAIVKKLVSSMLDTAKEVGTESQKAFDKFKAGVVAAGGTVTLLDRQLSQGLLKAMNTIKGASDRMFIELIRVSGPALLLLLQKIPGLLNKIGEAAPLVGKFLTANFLLAAAAVQTLTDQIALLQQAQAGNFTDVLARLALGPLQFIENFKKAKKEIATIGGLGTGGFTDKEEKPGRVRAAAEDLAASELALNRLQRQLTDTRVAFEQTMDAIEQQFRDGTLSAEEFFQRVVEEETIFTQRQQELLAEIRKRIAARPTLPRQKINELEELAAKETEVLNEANARIIAADRKANDALLKAAEERSKNIDKEAEALQRSRDQWEKYAEDVTQDLIKIHNAEVDLVDAIERRRIAAERAAEAGLNEVRAEIQREDPNSNVNLFGVDPLGELTKLEALKEGGRAALASLSASVGTFGGLMRNSLLAVAGAAQQVLATFILTGKIGGAAFKRLAADIIAQLIVMSAVKAIFELAEGLAAAATGNAAAAALHFAAAKLYGTVAGVAAAAGAAIGAFGGLEGDSGGSGAGSSFNNQQQLPTEIQIKRGDITGQLGGEGGLVSAWERNTAAIQGLHDKIAGMAPEDVLVVGANRRPDAVANATRRSLESDAGFIRTLGLAIERG